MRRTSRSVTGGCRVGHGTRVAQSRISRGCNAMPGLRGAVSDAAAMVSANAIEQPGAILRAERRAAGLSQQRLAERAGCSISMIRLLEAGYSPEASDVLERVATALSFPDERPDGNGALDTTSADKDGGDGTG